MLKQWFALVALLLLAVTGSVFAQTFGAVLTPGQEVPPTTVTGFGNATVTLDSTHTSLTVTITISGIGSTITGAHIHGPDAPAGVAKGVLIAFTPTATFTNGKLTGTFSIPQSVGDGIAASPQNYYVNVHTSSFPNGAIRGQLTVASGGTLLGGELRASNEPNNASTSTAVGAYTVLIDPTASTLTYEINTGGLANPTLAHIHKGAVGVNASPVVTFATSSSDFSGSRLKGVKAALDATAVALFVDIAANPASYYVNVHTTEFPGGAIRGQIAAANEYEVPVVGKVSGAGGSNFVTDVRIFNPSYDATATALAEYFTGASNTNATGTLAVSIPARGTAVLDDINGAALLNSPGSTGGLRVTSQGNLAITSRIYDDQRTNGKGTIGQSVDSVVRANALRRGVVPQLASSTALRTNVGFFNPNAVAGVARLELRDSTGAVVASANVNIGAYQQIQQSIGAWFPGVDFSNRANLSLSFDSNIPLDLYGSVLDNTSGDPIAITAQSDPGVATAP